MFIKVENIQELPELAIYSALRENIFKEDRSFIADSPKVVNIILEQNIEVKSILATKEYYDTSAHLLEKVPLKYITSKEQMKQIVGHKIHHNCMLHAIRPPHFKLCELGESVIMLDNITSAENVGSIARSAAALGVSSYLLPKESPHPFNRRALRVSMAYASYLKVSIYQSIEKSIEELQGLGYRIYAAEVAQNATLLSEVKPVDKWVLIVGHEGRGISENILKLCDEIVSIEMQESVKSFNVGVAASLIMYKLQHS